MTFRDHEGRPLSRIRLEQVLGADGLHGRLFQLAEGFSFEDADGTVHPVDAHDLTRSPVTWVAGVPVTTNGTDLASVPTVFWALIAPYGRQSPAAILHDQQSSGIDHTAPPRDRVAARVPVDSRFKRALRAQGVPRLRAHLMWAFVSLQSTFDPTPWRARAIIASVVVSVLATWAAIAGLVIAPSPWWLVGLAVPLLCLAAFWRMRALVATLLLTGVLLGALILPQLLIVALFRLAELVTSPGEAVATPTIAKYRIR